MTSEREQRDWPKLCRRMAISAALKAKCKQARNEASKDTFEIGRHASAYSPPSHENRREKIEKRRGRELGSVTVAAELLSCFRPFPARKR